MVSQVLCIGQSDSCAGTGIQADIKTVQAFGGYASTVVTAVSVQNTHGVFATHMIPPLLVRAQIEKVMEDLKPPVVKSGMLGTLETIDMLGDILDEEGYDGVKMVIDPVMTSRTGLSLLDKEARDALKRRLLIYADVVTPNITEAQDLSGIQIKDIDDMCHAAETLRTLGAKSVILKGGALAADRVYDVLADERGTEIYQNQKLESRSTHGAGTTLSSGIAIGLSQGLSVRDSFVRARAYVNKAIEGAALIGSGFGPLNHTITPDTLEEIRGN